MLFMWSNANKQIICPLGKLPAWTQRKPSWWNSSVSHRPLKVLQGFHNLCKKKKCGGIQNRKVYIRGEFCHLTPRWGEFWHLIESGYEQEAQSPAASPLIWPELVICEQATNSPRGNVHPTFKSIKRKGRLVNVLNWRKKNGCLFVSTLPGRCTHNFTVGPVRPPETLLCIHDNRKFSSSTATSLRAWRWHHGA